jgi:hypothetical protein
MDNDAISFSQPTGHRPPSRREVLWNELEQLHAQLGIEPPTGTYTLEALEEEVALAQRAAEQPANEGRPDFNSMPFDALPEGGDYRPRKAWANFYAALFFGGRPRLRHTGTRHARTRPNAAQAHLRQMTTVPRFLHGLHES